MNKINISRVDSVDKVSKILVKFNRVFNPPLDERILDFNLYAEKLIKHGYVYSAIESGETIGFISFYTNDNESNIGYLSQIATVQHYNVKGVGYELIKQFEKISFEKGMRTLKLEVSNFNKHAISFYKRNGYKYFGKATEISSYMIKNISNSEVI